MDAKGSDDLSKRFVSEHDLDERQKKRQEEWEKVRKPDDPIDVPDAPVDTRTLYERLQEQKEKERLEKEEPLKFKNQIHRLDDEEIGFLDLVSQQQQAINSQRETEENRIIAEIRNQSSTITSEPLLPVAKVKSRASGDSSSSTSRKSQQALLAAAVKRKGSSDQVNDSQKKTRTEETQEDNSNSNDAGSSIDNKRDNNSTSTAQTESSPVGSSQMKVIGLLPGICTYSDSSEDSSCSSSDSDVDVAIMDPFKTQIITQAQIEKMVGQQGGE